MSTAVPIIRQDGEGERMWFAGGGVFTWKATAAETGGAFLAFEDEMARGKSTPLHLHPNEDEVESRGGIRGSVRREHRGRRHLRVGRQQEGPLGGEVAVRGRARDARRDGGRLHGGGDAGGDQLAGGGHEGVTGALLLRRSAAELVRG